MAAAAPARPTPPTPGSPADYLNGLIESINEQYGKSADSNDSILNMIDDDMDVNVLKRLIETRLIANDLKTTNIYNKYLYDRDTFVDIVIPRIKYLRDVMITLSVLRRYPREPVIEKDLSDIAKKMASQIEHTVAERALDVAKKYTALYIDRFGADADALADLKNQFQLISGSYKPFVKLPPPSGGKQKRRRKAKPKKGGPVDITFL